jgi:hypothetical protein
MHNASCKSLKILRATDCADDFSRWSGWSGWNPSRFSLFVKCLTCELCKGRSENAECRMPGSDAAERLCRRYLLPRDEFHLRSRFLPNEANFSGRWPARPAKARQQPRPTGQAVRQDSLLFGYVRLCSLNGKKRELLRRTVVGNHAVFSAGRDAPAPRQARCPPLHELGIQRRRLTIGGCQAALKTRLTSKHRLI